MVGCSKAAVKAVFPPHLHTLKLSHHGLTTTKRSCSGLSFLSLAVRSDGTKAASQTPAGRRQSKPGKPQPICSKPAQVAELAAMTDRQRNPACLTTMYDENAITLEAWRLATGCAEL